MSEWLYVIRPVRDTFAEDATPVEEQAMRDHFAYLKSLLDAGKLILAGPSLEPLFGIVVFEAETEEEARRVVDGDPSVAAGVQRAELHPFRASLVRGSERT